MMMMMMMMMMMNQTFVVTIPFSSAAIPREQEFESVLEPFVMQMPAQQEATSAEDMAEHEDVHSLFNDTVSTEQVIRIRM
jgi:hypothetical protein